MTDAFICDAIRTPIGRYAGALKDVRADDIGALPLRELMRRNPGVDWSAVDDVIYGCANQAGEDNRNVARMSALLAGLPQEVSGTTINRLCGSGMDAVGTAARAIRAGEAGLMLAGGVESMTRAPFVMGKSEAAFYRAAPTRTALRWPARTRRRRRSAKAASTTRSCRCRWHRKKAIPSSSRRTSIRARPPSSRWRN